MAISRHLEKVLAHAERELVSTGSKKPTEALSVYKKFLRIEEHRLRLNHQSGGGGRAICALRVELIDVVLRHIFSAAARFAQSKGVLPTPLTAVALGGYGRGELNPFSDVDVMFLHDQNGSGISPYAGQVIEQILYLLWDIGFKVGHSTRSIPEAISLANTDMLTKTAMLESRQLAGDPHLTRRFRKQFRENCVRGREREYVELRMHDQAVRHAKFGDSVYMQEPNLKSGCGGLRDYQNLLWMTFFKEGALTTTHLVGRDWLSEADRKRIEVAYDFLLRLRTDLHYATGRATDTLHFTVQDQVAERLGYHQKGGTLRNEALMKDYYEHTRNIFRVTERITEQFASGQSSRTTRSLFGFLPRLKTREERVDHFRIRNRQLFLQRGTDLAKHPEAMMRAFQLAQDRQLDLSPELADLFTRNLGLVTGGFRNDPEPREVFKTIISRKGEVGRVLRMMHRIDFLGRYVPEFGQLTCLVQHEFFHRYTADEHTLVCIDKLDQILRTTDPKFRSYRKLFEKLEDPLVLYLALLLHDTGRAVGARPHSEASALFAQAAAVRLQLSPAQRRSLILLVDHHLTLSNTAQQRNLDDPETAVEFARIVKDQVNLDALMLLTLADGQGTSADAWSDWKEVLVWQLYHATSQYLSDQEAFFEQTKIERALLQKQVTENLGDDYTEEVDAHFEFMPDNYFRAFEVGGIASHLRLFRRFLENLYLRDESPLAPAVAWQAFPEQGHSIVSFCAWDAHELLAKIAGSFAVVPLNILSADIYTRGDNVVLDIFRVCDPKFRAVVDKRDHALVETTLRSALADENFDFAPLLDRARRKLIKRASRSGMDFPTRVSIENKTHPTYTLIQIQTPDRLGLLYELLSAFGEERVSIALSRISTEKGAAIDTFYVADRATRGKITDLSRITALQERLQRAALGMVG
ncbi:MAG: [protein-PII] uridylyltransferase [Verrucomicrobia bacterium]|nr:MAG: [protein-PII] uridylyltransferase [Verrucomicrobiota bacterium]